MGYSEAKEWRDAAVYQLHVGDTIYVGSTGNLKKRIMQHKTALKCGRHYNSKLQSEYNKEQLVIVEAEAVDTRSEAYVLEQVYLDTLSELCNVSPNARPGNIYDMNGSNNPNFGKFGELNPFYGRRHTEETKLAMSNSHVGRKNPAFGRVGAAHPLSKPISINGVRYESCGEASRALGISEDVIRGRVKSKNPKHVEYFQIMGGVFDRCG